MIDIDKFAKQGVLRSLVANKTDLEDQKKIKKEEGDQYPKKYGVNFFEVSAKDNRNIDELFLDAAKSLLEKNDNGLIEESINNIVLYNNKINLKKKSF